MHPQRIAPAAEGLKRLTSPAGWSPLFNSLIDNAFGLTHAELLFVLLRIRGGTIRDTVSDELWTRCTGKDPKMKNHAIRGLREKGLRVDGKGNKARYSFDEDSWLGWLSDYIPTGRAKTAGRSKSVTAKPGMQVHPDCEGKGCQRLCDPKAEVISISVPPARKPEPSPPPKPPPPKPAEKPPATVKTKLGNEIPAQHFVEIDAEIRGSAGMARAKNKQAYEAAIIAHHLKLLSKTESDTAIATGHNDRERELNAAHNILNWEALHLEKQRAETARARAILASQPRTPQRISGIGKTSDQFHKAERAEQAARESDKHERTWARDILDVSDDPMPGKPTEKEKKWARDVIAGSGQ